MRNRVISALIMLPLLLLVFIGGWALFVLGFAASIVGIREFYLAFEKNRIQPSLRVACVSLAGLYMLNAVTRFSGYQATDLNLYLFWLVISVLLSLIYLFRISERNMEDGMATLTGIVYVGFFAFHLLLMDRLDRGNIFIWLILITAFGSDIMAYLSGKFLGRHKLCAKISPNKTIEGAIGGVAGSALLCALFGIILLPDVLIHCIIVGVLGGVFAQLGDLTASVFKRNLGIKDFGSFIPGHGGVMDRIDSILYTAPLVYYYCAILQI